MADQRMTVRLYSGERVLDEQDVPLSPAADGGLTNRETVYFDAVKLQHCEITEVVLVGPGVHERWPAQDCIRFL